MCKYRVEEIGNTRINKSLCIIFDNKMHVEEKLLLKKNLQECRFPSIDHDVILYHFFFGFHTFVLKTKNYDKHPLLFSPFEFAI